MTADEKRMSIQGHLGELRVRLTRSVLCVLAGFMVAYAFHLELYELVCKPVRSSLAERGIYQLQALHVTESIFVYIKISIVAAVVGCAPIVLFQFWSFIAPGLYPRERKYVLPVALFSSIFFALGVLFAYFVLLPFVTGFLTDLTLSNESVNLQVTMQNVFSFSLLAMVLFGIIFELPIVMFFLSLFDVANHRQFIQFFRYFILLAFVVGALFTPPEPVSQVLMAVPMVALYGLGILIAFLVGRSARGEDGHRRPVGARIWTTVSIALLSIAVGIYALVRTLMPGPTPIQLLPETTTFAFGFNPSRIGASELNEELAALWMRSREERSLL